MKVKSFTLLSDCEEEGFSWNIITRITGSGNFKNKGLTNIFDNKEHYKKYKCYHKKYNKVHHKKWYRKHKKEIKEYQKKYSQTPEGKATMKKQSFKRRKLDFVPLNESFDECESHHIDKIHVIHIPKEMHKSVWHNIWTGQGMYEINVMAFDYLLNQDSVK